MRNSPQDVHKKVLGRAGEKRGAKFLKTLGYKILKTNYKTPFGEADIVAKDGDTVVFCEVKTRLSGAFGTPAEAVDGKKEKRYIDIARYFLMKAGRDDFAVRFDVLEVYEDRVNHIVGAFTA